MSELSSNNFPPPPPLSVPIRHPSMTEMTTYLIIKRTSLSLHLNDPILRVSFVRFSTFSVLVFYLFFLPKEVVTWLDIKGRSSVRFTTWRKRMEIEEPRSRVEIHSLRSSSNYTFYSEGEEQQQPEKHENKKERERERRSGISELTQKLSTIQGRASRGKDTRVAS